MIEPTKPSKPTYTRPTWSGDWSQWLEEEFGLFKNYLADQFGKY